MSIHIKLAATTCILFVFGPKMFIIEEKRSDYLLLCHKSLTEHHICAIKARKDTKLCQILKKKTLVSSIFTWTVSQKRWITSQMVQRFIERLDININMFACLSSTWFLNFKCLKSGWGKLTAYAYFQIYEN